MTITQGGKAALREEAQRRLFQGICLGDEEALRQAQEELYPRLEQRGKLKLVSSGASQGE